MRLLASFAFLSFLPALAGANSVMDRVQDAIKRVAPPVHSAPPKAGPTCTNYTGTWEGNCIDDQGKVEASKMEIKQTGCDEFEGSLPNALGSSLSQGWATAGDIGNLTITLDWNTDQTVLYSTISVFLRAIGQSTGYGLTIHESYAMMGTNLVSFQKLHVMGVGEGQSFEQEGQVRCTYSKK